MLENLKKRVFEQNIALVKHGLVVLTWGNVSAFDEQSKLVVIKPSGVAYETMCDEDMVVVDLDGNIVEGHYNPSSDLPTHLYIYKNMPYAKGVVHTHSTYATAFAQSGSFIPIFGTTHADAFYEDIPCSRELDEEEIKSEYEKNTGKIIAETAVNGENVPAVLVKSHGAFTWGNSPEKAVENAVTLEEVAKIAFFTLQINKDTPKMRQNLIDKHYFRKHGADSYYGQSNKK